MLRSDYNDQNCSVARALEVVGERWTLLIVRDLLLAPRRFLELQRRLDAPKNVLALRLEKLVGAGVVEKVEIDRARDWNTYRLTSKGLALYPVVSALMSWGDTYAAPQGPPKVVRHPCGRDVGHRLVCEGCGEPVDPLHLHTQAGPGWRSAQEKAGPDVQSRGGEPSTDRPLSPKNDGRDRETSQD